MEVTSLPAVAVRDERQIGSLRRAAVQLAGPLGFNEEDVGRVALVATELASNVVRHGGGGEVLLQSSHQNGAAMLEIVAIDRGPGIANVAEAMRDGMSTRGTAGTGLGAVRRLASRFDLYSALQAGTVVYAALRAARAQPAGGFEVGSVCVPYPGETVCGDGFQASLGEGRALLAVVDGLGHGPQAAEASARAAELFQAHTTCDPVALMERLHDGMRATRGAAAAVVEIDARRGVVRYCGVGNIAATILTDGTSRSLVSHHGTLGHDVRRIAEFQYPWSAQALLVVHSDGLTSHWDLRRYPGLAGRAATLIAAALYRDFRRQRDDTTVVVLREST